VGEGVEDHLALEARVRNAEGVVKTPSRTWGDSGDSGKGKGVKSG